MNFIVILLICLINQIHCEDYDSSSDSKNQLSPTDEKWIKTFDQFFASVKLLAADYRPVIEKSLQEVNISSDCSRSIRHVFTHTEEEWVISSEIIVLSIKLLMNSSPEKCWNRVVVYR